MTTSTLTTIVDTPDENRAKSATETVLPIAGGLPDRTAIRARRPEERVQKRSRVHRPHGSGGTVGLPPPYKWRDPFTWVDGSMYGVDLLTQQFVTNLQEVPHVFGVLQEDMVDSSGLVVEPYYKPVFPELTVPMGSNEIWWFLEVIRWSGSGVLGTDITRWGWYTPLDAGIQGTGPTLDAGGNAYLHNIQVNATLETQIEWESGIALPGHNVGEQRLTWMEFYVTTGAIAGDLECGFSTVTDGIEATVYAGTCLMGMRVTP